ncbi:hypothetical protein R1sor_007410 [Riccia sorocarpa]|uniref:Uncharacterized protein n=1 Tax=Riccia sorocarpa TaxID=122646 RepID=A0ABD3HT04_9MARC
MESVEDRSRQKADAAEQVKAHWRYRFYHGIAAVLGWEERVTFGDDRYWGDSFHRAIKAFWPEESTAASVPPKPVVPLNPESPPSRDASSPSQSFTSEVLIPLHGVITCKIKSSCTLDTSSPSVVVDSLTTAIHKRRKLPRWIQRLAEPVRMSGYVSSSGEDDEYTSSG